MKTKLMILVGALLALSLGVDAKPKPLKHPVPIDAEEAMITSKVMSDFFANEINIRDRMLADRFFAKPLSDQKSSIGEIVAYLGLDPLHGLTPRFSLDSKGEQAKADYMAWDRYMFAGHVHSQLMALVRKAQIVMFDRSGKMVEQLEFYNQVGREALAGLKVFDDYMYKLASGAPAFKKEPESEGATWSDLLKYCKIDPTMFLYYFQFDGNNSQLKIEAAFLNQLDSAKKHGDDLPPPKVEEWVKAAEKFLEEDVAQYRKTIAAAIELAGKHDRIQAIYQKDVKLVEAIEKVLKGMISMQKTFTGETGLGQLRTGKGLYKYTTRKYSLPAFHTDTVVDHVYFINLMLQRFQSYMHGLKVNRTGVTEEQKRKAAAWRRKHMKAEKK